MFHCETNKLKIQPILFLKKIYLNFSIQTNVTKNIPMATISLLNAIVAEYRLILFPHLPF